MFTIRPHSSPPPSKKGASTSAPWALNFKTGYYEHIKGNAISLSPMTGLVQKKILINQLFKCFYYVLILLLPIGPLPHYQGPWISQFRVKAS